MYTGYQVRQRPPDRQPGSARRLSGSISEGMQRNLAAAEASIAEPYRGITVDGNITPGLFPIQATGVSTPTTLGSSGFETAHNVMRLNETIREITGRAARVYRLRGFADLDCRHFAAGEALDRENFDCLVRARAHHARHPAAILEVIV